MSTQALGVRLGVAHSSVIRLESSELQQTIQLGKLAQAADALGCDLVYALVPRLPLEDAVRHQARRKASAELAPVRHTMLLEAQTPDADDVDSMVAAAAESWVDRPGLWNA